MITAINAARAVCEFTGWQASNLSLQKILYIAHGTYMAKKGGSEYPLIDADFHAWHYGPVVPGLYHEFKLFGPDPIGKYALTEKRRTDAPDEAKDEIAHIKDITVRLADKKSSRLVALTHADGGAWGKWYVPKASNRIPDEDIYEEYRRG